MILLIIIAVAFILGAIFGMFTLAIFRYKEKDNSLKAYIAKDECYGIHIFENMPFRSTDSRNKGFWTCNKGYIATIREEWLPEDMKLSWDEEPRQVSITINEE